MISLTNPRDQIQTVLEILRQCEIEAELGQIVYREKLRTVILLPEIDLARVVDGKRGTTYGTVEIFP